MRRLALIAAVAAFGCRDSTAPLCPPGAACATPCADAADCDSTEICNATGRCQRRAICRRNADCEAAEMCDATTGVCVPSAACLRDLHCPFGAVCVSGECVAGCAQTGDCPLYQSCDQGLCVEECLSNDFCDLGAVCAAGTCYPSPNPSHCATCSADRACPYENSDFCLLNHAYDRNKPEFGPPRYCGVDCSEDTTKCPNGYDCEAVVLLTQDECERDIHCGRLDRFCRIEEGATRGFCTCGTDVDCLPDALPPRCRLGFCEAPVARLCSGDDDCIPLKVCDRHGGASRNVCVTNGFACNGPEDCMCNEGRCLNTGRTCSQGSDCRLSCVSGLCYVGATCTPSEGLYCPDLRD